MRCETCGNFSFEVKADAAIHEDSARIYSSHLSKVKVMVTVKIICKRCRQRYGGEVLSRVVIPFNKLERQPFPEEVITQCRTEFGIGWDVRHGSAFSSQLVSAEMPASLAGWEAANEWAKDKKGRPPMKGGWKEVVNTYLETEPAWEYMRTLVTNRAFSE